jgi:hypothetical protein
LIVIDVIEKRLLSGPALVSRTGDVG